MADKATYEEKKKAFEARIAQLEADAKAIPAKIASKLEQARKGLAACDAALAKLAEAPKPEAAK